MIRFLLSLGVFLAYSFLDNLSRREKLISLQLFLIFGIFTTSVLVYKITQLGV